MSVTYPTTPTEFHGEPVPASHSNAADGEPFVPVYARRGKARGRKGGIRTWMILTPVAVLVLGGVGAMLLTQGPEESPAPLAEPAATAPVLPLAPTGAAVTPATPREPTLTTTAPVARDAAPLRRAAPAPARREAVRTLPRTPTPVPTPATTPRVAAPVPASPAGPRAYTPAPAATPTSTPRLNTTPATPVPATPASTPPPLIIVEPVG